MIHSGAGVYANPQDEAAANFEPTNQLLSRSGTATQSSTSTSETFRGVNIPTPAARAIDGNSNGRINVGFYQQGLDSLGSSAITTTVEEPWWELDLGEEKIIEYIDIWNTVDMHGEDIETPSAHFNNFYVLIDDQPFGNVDLATALSNSTYQYYHSSGSLRVLSLNDLNLKGRYIRIQASGTTKIGLAEVDVIGRDISTTPDCNGVANGTAYIDECGNCVKGNTGIEPCALDANYEWGGTATSSTLNSSKLPVELLSFDATAFAKYKVKLEWTTATEIDNDYFTIERSLDGYQWEAIGEVDGSGNSLSPRSYQSFDHDPYNGVNYYRLKQTDFDGSYSYSEIRSVTFTVINQGGINVYPNPVAKGRSFIIKTNFVNDQGFSLQLFNANGQLMKSYPAQQNTALEVFTDQLPSGLYYYQVRAENGQLWNGKLVVVE